MNASKLIKTEEAFRAKPYYCTAGMPTIGYGRVIGKKGDPLPSIETTPQAESDFVEKEITRLEFKLAGIYPNAWSRCNEARQAVLVSMAYQLGVAGISAFRKMWAAIEKGDWKEASTQMLDSLAARQTPARWKRNAYMMETGILHNYYK